MSGKTICANCEYFVLRSGNGECHLNPPFAIGRSQNRIVPNPNNPPMQFRSGFAFPNVALTDFCKYHFPRVNYNIAPTGEVALPVNILNAVLVTEQHSSSDEGIAENAALAFGDGITEYSPLSHESSTAESEDNEGDESDEETPKPSKVKPPTPKS